MFCHISCQSIVSYLNFYFIIEEEEPSIVGMTLSICYIDVKWKISSIYKTIWDEIL
jgi:hypothetical protein